jgi:hypothetical protein
VLVRNIRGGAASSSPNNLTDVAGTLFFAANNGPDGFALWKAVPPL